MGCRRVAGITAEHVRQLWSLWRAGEPVTAIAEALQRPDTLIRASAGPNRGDCAAGETSRRAGAEHE